VLALVGIGGVALLMGLGLAWILAGSLSRPLRALAGTARRVERGDLDARAEVTGSSEQREVAVAFNDMTERLAQVLAAQREFVGNASHQLRTPLTGLRLRLEAASLKATDPELERDLAAAERETERLAKLLSALLTLAREGERPPAARPVDLADAAARACERWRAQAERGGQRLVLAGEGRAVALASDEDVAIVLDNLIENALAYSPPGTAVTVEWDIDGEAARLAVLDEGPGLQPGEEAAVFGRFTRGSSSRGGAPGTGLGLAIVQTLVRRWGGDAGIANRDEGGARAVVTLPAGELMTDGRAADAAVRVGSDRA
jgi:two-component system, OmpR family, sensor kinase